MTKIRGRMAFPDRRWEPAPQVGDEWEVTIAGENPAKTVYFLLPVRLISTQAERERWNAALEATKDCGYHQLGLSHEEVAKIWLEGGDRSVDTLISSRISSIREEIDRIFGKGEFEKASLCGDESRRWKMLQNCRLFVELQPGILEHIKATLPDVDFESAVEIAYRMKHTGMSPKDAAETIRREKEAQLSDRAAYEIALRRARELASRVRPKEEEEEETIYVSEYTVTEYVDFRDIHSSEKVRKIYVSPVKPPLEYEDRYPYETELPLLKRLVPYIKDMTPESLDELVEGEDELAMAINALYRAIHPWRWKRVHICLTDEAKERVMAEYQDAEVVFKEAIEYVPLRTSIRR